MLYEVYSIENIIDSGISKEIDGDKSAIKHYWSLSMNTCFTFNFFYFCNEWNENQYNK